jgi:hypothetical protein
MTGQVKEEIITRRAELGLFVRDGRIRFDPLLVRTAEFLRHPETFEYVDVAGTRRTLRLDAGTLAFTTCQTLFVLHLDADERIVVRLSDGTEKIVRDGELDPELSREIFTRAGRVERVDVFVEPDRTVSGPLERLPDVGQAGSGGDAP